MKNLTDFLETGVHVVRIPDPRLSWVVFGARFQVASQLSWFSRCDVEVEGTKRGTHQVMAVLTDTGAD